MEILANGAEETFDNAERLYFEAELLAKVGAVSLLLGLEVDQKKVPAGLARHSSKNKSNA